MLRRIAALCVLASLIAGCSGSVTAVPTPTPTDAGLSVATQRLEAQAAMAVGNGIQAASLLAVLLTSLQGLERGKIEATAPKCQNGVEVTVTPITPESFHAMIGIFYDPACKDVLARAELTAILMLPSKLTIAGTQTTYNRAGRAVGYGTIANDTTVSATSTRAVTHGSISATPSGAPVLTFGLTCTLAASNACGFGGIVAPGAQGQSLGVAATLKNFVAAGSSNDGTVTVNGYTGAPGTMTLHQGSGIAWAIDGGVLAASLAGTFTEDVNASAFSVAGSLALTDALENATTTENFGTRSGIGHGVVSETSSRKAFATFSTNATGSGTIGYSNRSTGKIVLFVITN